MIAVMLQSACREASGRVTWPRADNLEYNAAMGRLMLLLRCLILVALMLLPACAATTSQSGGSPSPDPAVLRKPDTVTLTLWHSWSGANLEALNTLARTYEQQHPDVRIRLESRPATTIMQDYSRSVADGSAPQMLLILGRYVGDLAKRRYIAPLDSAFQPAALSDVFPQALDAARFDGQLYAMPIALDVLTLFYNRKQVSAPPTTFDAVLALNTAQRVLPPDQRSLSLAYFLALEYTLPYLSAFGGSVFGEDGQPTFATQDKDATVRWLEWLQSLRQNEQVLASWDFSAVDGAVQQGRVLSAIDWAHRRANYAQVWGADAVGIAALPAINQDAAPKTVLLPEVLAINPVVSAEQRGAAEDFLRYMINRASQETLSAPGDRLPVQRRAKVQADAEPFMAVIEQAQPLGSRLTDPTIWNPLNDMLRSVMTNAASPSEAVDAAGAALSKPAP